MLEYLNVPLIFLSAPLLGRTLSLAYNKNNIQPKIWLTIYGIMIFLMVITFAFNAKTFSNQTKDLFYAFSNKYLSTIGEVEFLNYKGSNHKVQICTINELEFEINPSDFYEMERGKLYKFEYLPSTRYVLNIFDEEEKSLLKR